MAGLSNGNENDEYVAPVINQDLVGRELAAFSFFGDMSAADEALEGELEAPPPEQTHHEPEIDGLELLLQEEEELKEQLPKHAQLWEPQRHTQKQAIDYSASALYSSTQSHSDRQAQQLGIQSSAADWPSEARGPQSSFFSQQAPVPPGQHAPLLPMQRLAQSSYQERPARPHTTPHTPSGVGFHHQGWNPQQPNGYGRPNGPMQQHAPYPPSHRPAPPSSSPGHPSLHPPQYASRSSMDPSQASLPPEVQALMQPMRDASLASHRLSLEPPGNPPGWNTRVPPGINSKAQPPAPRGHPPGLLPPGMQNDRHTAPLRSPSLESPHIPGVPGHRPPGPPGAPYHPTYAPRGFSTSPASSDGPQQQGLYARPPGPPPPPYGSPTPRPPPHQPLPLDGLSHISQTETRLQPHGHWTSSPQPPMSPEPSTVASTPRSTYPMHPPSVDEPLDPSFPPLGSLPLHRPPPGPSHQPLQRHMHGSGPQNGLHHQPPPGRGRGHFRDGNSPSRHSSVNTIYGFEFWVHDHRCMAAHELEELLAFNMRNTHSGEMYADDYYYQAFLNKYYNGFNTNIFRPFKLYTLAPHERTAGDEAMHAKVDGLGKFVYASLRTPRQLLAVDARAKGRQSLERSPFPASIAAALFAGTQQEGTTVKAVAEEVSERSETRSEGGVVGQRSMQTDRRVAARKVLEDCNCQLLDVDDIDRVVASDRAVASERHGALPPPELRGEAGAERDHAYLAQRRQLLMENIVEALRLGHDGPRQDGVFQYLMSFPKGRKLAALVLERIAPLPRGATPSAAHGLGMLLGVLRNPRLLFGDNHCPPPTTGVVVSDDALHIAAATALAAAAADAIARLTTADDIIACFDALVDSDIVSEVPEGWDPSVGILGLLPLLLLRSNFEPDNAAPWFGSVLIALFNAAGANLTAGAAAEAFRRSFAVVCNRVVIHLMTLLGLLERAKDMGEAAAASAVRELAAVPVLQSMLMVCTKEEEQALTVPLLLLVDGAGGVNGVME